jgi:predicted RNase H-like HicB family nuclease
MATVVYPAVVERAGKAYSVFFPDLPGCTSAGATVNEAVLNAEEALGGHLLVAAQHNEDVADPSDISVIAHDPEVDEVARILVRAEKPGKAVRINVTIDDGLLAAIDRVAKNRSGFLAEAARDKLATKRILEDA